MQLSELIEQLQAIADSTEGDPEVLTAYQENYPLAGTVANVRELDGQIWIAVGGAPQHLSPYAPRAAWEEQ